MIRKHIIKEGADWWKIFTNRIVKEASNKAIENGCNNELVNNLLNNSNIFVEKNGDGYVLFNNNDIICKIPKTSSFDDMVVMSINALTNWITTKLNKNMNENKKQIKLTESEFKQLVSESVKSVINEISKSGMKKKWINKIYKVITPLTSSIYRDDAWQNAKYVLNAIENVVNKNAEMNVWCENGGYWKQIHEFPNYKEYKFSIYFPEDDFEINGSLKCHAAGTLENPFERYDITVTMW